MRPCQRVTATFSPRYTTDLAEEAHPWIGRDLDFRVGWLITDADAPQYAGQRAMIPIGDIEPYLGWVPLSDLSNVREFSQAAG